MDRHIIINVDYRNWKRSNWKEEMKFEKTFKGYQEEFVNVLSEFGWMWDHHLRRMTVANGVELMRSDAHQIHWMQYRARQKDWEFEWMEIEKMLPTNFIKSAETEWAAQIVFEPKKDGSLQVTAEYRKLNSVTV